MTRRLCAASAAVLALAACTSNKAATTASTTPVTSPASSSTPSVGVSILGPSSDASSTVTFAGFTIKHVGDMSTKPDISGKGDHIPTKLEYKDLVVGSGPAANPTSYVTVQYYGLRIADGSEFQASWDAPGAQPIPFSLTGVVAGFTDGIGGTSSVPPMKVGGRRLILLPAALAYGSAGTPDGTIKPNTAIAFIVDLLASR